MSEAAKPAEKAPKKSWFKGLKSEMGKIIWPDRESLVKQSIAVTVVTLILGILIALIDLGVKAGIDLIL